MINNLLQRIKKYRAFLALKKQYKINQQIAREKQQQQEDFYSKL